MRLTLTQAEVTLLTGSATDFSNCSAPNGTDD